jgi:hypothetical protein
VADTQSIARPKGNHGPQRQGNYTNNNSNVNAGNSYNNNNMTQYNNGPPPPDNYDTYSRNESNYSMNNNNGNGSLKRKKLTLERFRNKNKFEILGSMSTSFTIKMRGVPFEAAQKDIYEV